MQTDRQSCSPEVSICLTVSLALAALLEEQQREVQGRRKETGLLILHTLKYHLCVPACIHHTVFMYCVRTFSSGIYVFIVWRSTLNRTVISFSIVGTQLPGTILFPVPFNEHTTSGSVCVSNLNLGMLRCYAFVWFCVFVCFERGQ